MLAFRTRDNEERIKSRGKETISRLEAEKLNVLKSYPNASFFENPYTIYNDNYMSFYDSKIYTHYRYLAKDFTIVGFTLSPQGRKEKIRWIPLYYLNR